MEHSEELDVATGPPHKASKPLSALMIAGLAVVAAVVLGALFYTLSPYLASEVVDAEEIPGVEQAD